MRFVFLCLWVGLALLVGCSSTPEVESTPTPPGSGEACGDACSTPPASRCADETSVEAFASNGACVEGVCQYEATRSVCASDETCRDGACVNHDTTFASLVANPGPVAFDASKTHYVVTAPIDAESLSVTAVLANTKTSLFVDDQPARSGTAVSIPFGLDAVRREVRFRAVAVSGASATYSVLFLRYGQQAYVKSSNAEENQGFGGAVAMSADGTTLAVGASGEASSAKGINGVQTDRSAPRSGAVYVFRRSVDGAWAQEAYVKASNSDAGDSFGKSVALSADGATLAVGASDESSNATGVNGNATDNSAPSSGAAYVFRRSAAGMWSQEAYIKAAVVEASDLFGGVVSLSADGATLAVGAYGEDSGVVNNPSDNSASSSGAAYVFRRSAEGVWSQEAYLKAANAGAQDYFGYRVALAANGASLVVGAYFEDSNATGANGNAADNSASNSGAAYVFRRSTAGTWAQEAYLKASNTGAQDFFGYGVGISADGTTVAVGAPGEGSRATGVNGEQGDNSFQNSGAVYVFQRNAAAAWNQEAYVKGVVIRQSRFGETLSLADDGASLAVSAPWEASNATGVNGNVNDETLPNSGAVFLYRRSGTGLWSREAYLKASNTGENDGFGATLAFSRDGSALVVSAEGEASRAKGVDGNQGDNSAAWSGAVYVFAL